MRKPPLTVSLVGWSKEGKTKLASRFIAHYRSQGYHVAAVKKSGGAVQLDRRDSDSDILRRSGAESTALLAPDLTAFFYARPLEEDELLESFPGAEIIIAEGLVFSEGLLLEIVGEQAAREGLKSSVRDFPRAPDAYLLTAAPPEGLFPPGGRLFREGQFTQILSFLEEQWNEKYASP